MSTIKKALSKIVHARGSKTPTGAETPTRSSTHDESITEVDDTNADGETAAQRQQRVESINSKRSKSLARSRDQTPLTRFKSPDNERRARSQSRPARDTRPGRDQSQVRPGGRSRSRARRMSFTEERIKRTEEKAKEDEEEAKARKERMATAWSQVCSYIDCMCS
jgi:hypothetical protein